MASASRSHFLLSSIIFFFIFTILSSNAQNDKPRAFHIPITIDTETHQYYASFQLGTPPTNINAVLNVGDRVLTLDCDNFSSSTHRFLPCKSTKCTDLKVTSCGSNDTCTFSSHNPFSRSLFRGVLADDVVTVHETDGTAALISTYSTNLDFSCASSDKLTGLAKGTSGILGLGQTPLTLPTLLSSAFNIVPKFALCLPSSNELGFGDLFIGGGPYRFPGGEDATDWLVYTPFIYSFSSGYYFITVNSVKIDKRVVRFGSNNDRTVVGQTKISTVTRYTVLRSAVYKAVVDDFVKRAAARNITRVAAVEPFGACFSTENLHWTRAGPRVPLIELELPGRMGSVDWRIHGANSMVRVNKNTLCLGFVEGASDTNMVLGGYQLEDNFLLFDLSTSTLGFSSSIIPRGATCSHFRNL
ncbi:Aspartic peptidase [Parasponia andersonii]|uniref:Aspartic peptidase n=1 Tax=Parasponia andersonii TaxID=3476 RepID=A0A2P5E3P8_PARAD|nr:Aspartic peptidase [Parasponia andersonii]